MVEIINDGFGGGSSGDDIEGRTPDTTNTPGDTWADDAANTVELTGAGKVTVNGTRRKARIDCADATVRVSVDITGNSGIRPSVFLNANDSNDFTTSGSLTGYVVDLDVGFNGQKIWQYNSSSARVKLAERSPSYSLSTDSTITFENDGTGSGNLICEVDGGDQLTATDATYTGTFVGFGSLGATVITFDNFTVDDLSTGVTTYYQTISAVTANVATSGEMPTFGNAISATATASATLSKVSTFYRGISVTATAAASTVKKMFKTISATSTVTASVSGTPLILQAISATATATATVTNVFVAALGYLQGVLRPIVQGILRPIIRILIKGD